MTRRRGHPEWNHHATGAFTGAAWFGLRTSKNSRVNRLRHSCDWCDSWAKENAGVPTNDTNENLALMLIVEIGPAEQIFRQTCVWSNAASFGRACFIGAGANFGVVPPRFAINSLADL